MKRIVLQSPGRFATQDVAEPRPGPGEALVRVRKVGICGSDIHLFRKGRIGDIVLEGPFVIGHECMGVVGEVGPGVSAGLKGRRVAIEPAVSCGRCSWCRQGDYNVCPDNRFLGLPPRQGALQQCLVHPADLIEPLPDEIGDAAAVMLEPMAIALSAVRLAGVRPGQRVAILGTGVMGTCVLAALGLYRGVRVVCADLMADRLERALRMGAAEVVQPGTGSNRQVAAELLAAIGGYGADVVFECAGAEQTLWNMCEVAAPAACVAVIGSSHDDRVIFSSGTARRKGLTLRIVRRSLHTLRPCIELTAAGVLKPGDLVTHTFPASEIERAFRTVDEYADGVLKALVDMERC